MGLGGARLYGGEIGFPSLEKSVVKIPKPAEAPEVVKIWGTRTEETRK